jgi:hypothetical protein
VTLDGGLHEANGPTSGELWRLSDALPVGELSEPLARWWASGAMGGSNNAAWHQSWPPSTPAATSRRSPAEDVSSQIDAQRRAFSENQNVRAPV